jgi:hypothetical protein
MNDPEELGLPSFVELVRDLCANPEQASLLSSPLLASSDPGPYFAAHVYKLLLLLLNCQAAEQGSEVQACSVEDDVKDLLGLLDEEDGLLVCGNCSGEAKSLFLKLAKTETFLLIGILVRERHPTSDEFQWRFRPSEEDEGQGNIVFYATLKPLP